MGLSNRRRVKKEDTNSNTTEQSLDANSCQRKAQTRRTGNTLRRVTPESSRDRRRTNLMAIEVHPAAGAQKLTPKRKRTVSETGLPALSQNLNGKSTISMMGNSFNTNVSYSLNKHTRWRFLHQFKAAAASNASDTTNVNLCDHNLFLTESAASGSKRVESVTGAASNTHFMLRAAGELTEHKNSQRDQSRRRVAHSDSFQFSDQLRLEQMQRRLTELSTDGRKLNINSIQGSYSKIKQVNSSEVSQSAEMARQHLQTDYDSRMEISVGIRTPSSAMGANRFRQAEKKNHTERRLGEVSRNYLYRNGRGTIEILRECEDALQPDMVESQEYSCCPILSSGSFRQVSLRDAMVLKDGESVSANRLRKQVMKTRKLEEFSSRDEGRSSSGYDSCCDLPFLDLEETVATCDAVATGASGVVEGRVSEAIDAALVVQRPIVKFPRELADRKRLESMFNSVGGEERVLVMGNSVPKKLAVLLQPDLSESVVFEEVDDPCDAHFATYAVRHVCALNPASNEESKKSPSLDKPQLTISKANERRNRMRRLMSKFQEAVIAPEDNKILKDAVSMQPKTSASEVASQADPLEFLSTLIARIEQQPDLTQKYINTAAPGWRRVNALTETSVRLAALRALPMFQVAERGELMMFCNSSSECGICCQLLSQGAKHGGSKSFAEGSTMLIECGHHFCNTCWLHHVATSVASGRPNVTCPGFSCHSVLDAATLLWFCPSDLLSALTSTAFHVWLTERKSGGPQRRVCSGVRCDRVLECRSGVNAECGRCGRQQCLGCGQEAHWPADCSTAKRYLQRLSQQGHANMTLSDLTVKSEVMAKQCPTCGLIIEKGIGCNHMSCPCGEHFCWFCSQTLKLHRVCSDKTSFRRSAYHIRKTFRAEDTVLGANKLRSEIYCEAVRIRLHRVPIERMLNGKRSRIAELFESEVEIHCDRKKTLTDARRIADQLVDFASRAAHLVEFAYAHLDIHRAERRINSTVRSVGSVVWELVQEISEAVQENCKKNGMLLTPRQTAIACKNLQSMLIQLRSKYCQLHHIVAMHREGCLSAHSN